MLQTTHCSQVIIAIGQAVFIHSVDSFGIGVSIMMQNTQSGVPVCAIVANHQIDELPAAAQVMIRVSLAILCGLVRPGKIWPVDAFCGNVSGIIPLSVDVIDVAPIWIVL